MEETVVIEYSNMDNADYRKYRHNQALEQGLICNQFRLRFMDGDAVTPLACWEYEPGFYEFWLSPFQCKPVMEVKVIPIRDLEESSGEKIP